MCLLVVVTYHFCLSTCTVLRSWSCDFTWSYLCMCTYLLHCIVGCVYPIEVQLYAVHILFTGLIQEVQDVSTSTSGTHIMCFWLRCTNSLVCYTLWCCCIVCNICNIEKFDLSVASGGLDHVGMLGYWFMELYMLCQDQQQNAFHTTVGVMVRSLLFKDFPFIIPNYSTPSKERKCESGSNTNTNSSTSTKACLTTNMSMFMSVLLSYSHFSTTPGEADKLCILGCNYWTWYVRSFKQLIHLMVISLYPLYWTIVNAYIYMLRIGTYNYFSIVRYPVYGML